MKPKFKDIVTWQQAELLMQPAFLRVIDNIRKQLEASLWEGTYENVLIWPEGSTEETQATVLQLRQQLQDASPEAADEIKQALTQLPNPYPGYRLSLQYQTYECSVDLWELCYQVCFLNYNLAIVDPDHQGVEIDTNLIDQTGEVDWHQLEEKTQQVIAQVFKNLPSIL